MDLAEITAQVNSKLEEGIIDGKAIGNEMRAKMKIEIEEKDLKPFLATIIVGEDDASKLYVGMKERACNAIGIKNTVKRLPSDTSQNELAATIKALNDNPEVNGILLQLPLPDHLNETDATMLIDPDKDVDGLHYVSVGKLQVGLPGFIPCTPYGCMKLLERAGVELKGLRAAVIGRSNLVGRPMVRLLESKNATVTLCHSRTVDLPSITRESDVIIAAAGRAKLLTEDMVSEGTVIIDVGTNVVDGKLVGDVDFENVKKKAKLISPVPGGVGPMTITMLLNNTIESYKRANDLD